MKRPKYHVPASVRSLVVKAYLNAIARSGKPIIIGPWRSELGFEALYWMPFISWALHYAGIKADRCLAVSRGGMGTLYSMAARQCDLYMLKSVDEMRLQNRYDEQARGERGKDPQKPDRVTVWDREVCDLAAKEAGMGAYHLLHPSWMYWLFEPVWKERATIRHVLEHTRYEGMPAPNLPESVVLPPQFVAVRFYERSTLPVSNPEIKHLVTTMVESIASRIPVVLLNQPGIFADDHVDLPLSGPNIHVLPKVHPSQNFLLQASVLARAQAFVGTYGGVAQWALRYAKPTLAFYAEFSQTAYAHRALSDQLSSALKVPFQVGDLRAIRLWQAALGGVTDAKPAMSTVA